MKTVTIKTILLCVSLFLVGLFFASSSYAKIDSKTIVGMWLFNEGKGDTAKDFTGNGNDGALKGNVKWVKGKFGSALEFDGNSYVEILDSDSLDMDKQITIMFWVKTTKTMVDMWNDRQVVVGKHFLEYEVGIYMQGQIHTYTNDGAGNPDEGIMASIAGKLPDKDADWELDKWYHIAWTLDKQHEVAYVNGIKLGDATKAHEGTKPGEHTLAIGRRQEGSLPLTGAVDEVVILNVTLEEKDIQSCLEGMEKALGLTAVSSLEKLATSWGSIKFGY